jgi:hypothetical protein
MTYAEASQHASPEAVAYAMGACLSRNYAADDSRLADLVVKAVQIESRKRSAEQGRAG